MSRMDGGSPLVSDPNTRNILFITGMDQKGLVPFLLKRNISFVSGATVFRKDLKRIPDFQIDMLPVIETGAFDPSTIQ